MRDLQVKDTSSTLRDAPPPSPSPARGDVAEPNASWLRAPLSLVFLACYVLYLVLFMGAGQRLVIWPLITLLPSRRRAIVRWWLRTNARATLGMARLLAGVRLTVQGSIADEPCVAVMNHQSVLDIPLGIYLIPGPYPLIPTRDRYGRGIPGISPLSRLARFPLLAQRRSVSRAELRSLVAAAEQVAAGQQSLLIYPEGHRTRRGEIAPFMKPGLRLILSRARRPVYVIVADGIWHVRTFIDAALRFVGTSIDVIILGPFTPPSNAAELDAFIDTLHRHMEAALVEIRTHRAVSPQP
ncbi:MAG: lysophospholipid acyltransferase family protein [Gemmatimonadaceae bacterium]